MYRAIILLLLFAAGCAAHDERADLRKHCGQPGSETDMRCARPVKSPPQDLVKICDRRGASRDERDCYYVTREEVDRWLMSMGL
jgi:hypothetical protein